MRRLRSSSGGGSKKGGKLKSRNRGKAKREREEVEDLEDEEVEDLEDEEIEDLEDDDEEEVEDLEEEEPEPEPEPEPKKKSKGKKKGKSGALAKKAETALASIFESGPVAEFGAFEEDEVLGGGGPSFAFLDFFDPGKQRRQEIEAALGELSAGDKYIAVPEEDGSFSYYEGRGLEYMILGALPHWVRLDASFQPEAVIIGKRRPKGEGWKQNVLTLTLIVPGKSKSLPDELGLPCFATVSNFRTYKCDAVKEHFDAIKASTQSGWAEKEGGHAAELLSVGFPPKYRVASKITTKTGTAKQSKRPYEAAKARPHALYKNQVQALIDYWNSEEGMEQFEAATDAFKARKEWLQDQDESEDEDEDD